MTKLMPNDTAHIIESTSQQTDNLYLDFNKMLSYEKKNGDKLEFDKRRKMKEIKRVFNNSKSMKIAGNIYANDKKLILSAETADYLLVGLGSESVLETSLTLHHIYGVPYIPGSAIKGSLRSYIVVNYFDKDEEKALKNNDFLKIFGGVRNNNEKVRNSEHLKGKVVFYDSFPESNFNIHPDILTPHYSKYYKDPERNPPADIDSPVPVQFLSVRGKFIFCIGIIGNFTTDEKMVFSNNESLSIKDFFIEMLTKGGIGAKTAVGYGYFKNIEKFDEIEEDVEPESSNKTVIKLIEFYKRIAPGYKPNMDSSMLWQVIDMYSKETDEDAKKKGREIIDKILDKLPKDDQKKIKKKINPAQ